MDAREETPLAPFLGGRARRESPAQRHARLLERGEPDADRGGCEAGARRERLGGDRARALEPAACNRPAGGFPRGILPPPRQNRDRPPPQTAPRRPAPAP